MTAAIRDSLAQVQELLGCPFCGCAMRFDSNRDWHHLTGQHEEHCLFEMDDPVLTVPATDDAKQWAVSVWNTRKCGDALVWEARRYPNGLKRYLTQKQYEAQTEAIKVHYKPTCEHGPELMKMLEGKDGR